MKSIGYDRRESKAGEMFNARRESLRARYYTAFAGGDVDDALARAFAFTVKGLLAKPDDFDARDFEVLICWKLDRLIKDMIAAAKRSHGRRSVKPSVFFDDEPMESEGRSTTLMDRVSLARHAECVYREGDEDRFLLQLKAIETILKKTGTTDRDFAIFDQASFCAADREAIARSFKTSVSNINRIACECRQLAKKYSPQIRAYYVCLLKKQGLEAA